jgi:hypothetical protein
MAIDVATLPLRLETKTHTSRPPLVLLRVASLRSIRRPAGQTKRVGYLAVHIRDPSL